MVTCKAKQARMGNHGSHFSFCPQYGRPVVQVTKVSYEISEYERGQLAIVAGVTGRKMCGSCYKLHNTKPTGVCQSNQHWADYQQYLADKKKRYHERKAAESQS